MMGNAVQCDAWCESQYDGEVTSCGSRTKDHEPALLFAVKLLTTAMCILSQNAVKSPT